MRLVLTGLVLSFLAVTGCGTESLYSGAYLGGTQAVLSSSHAIADGQQRVAVTVTMLRANGEAIPGVQVVLAAENCIVTQPGAVTDSEGGATGWIVSDVPGSHLVDIAFLLGGQQVAELPTHPSILFAGAGSVDFTAGVASNVLVTVPTPAGGAPYSGALQVQSSDPLAELPKPFAVHAAQAGTQFVRGDVIFHASGAQTLTDVESNGRLVETIPAQVQAGPASTLTLSPLLDPSPAGVSQDETVTVLDAYGNIVHDYVGSIAFTSSDGQATVPAPVTLTLADQGVKYLANAVTLRTSGVQDLHAFDVSNNLVAAVPLDITVVAAAPAVLRWQGPANAAAGVSFFPSVALVDSYGNVAQDFSGSVAVTTSDSQAAAPSQLVFTAADRGQKNLSVTLKTMGPQTLTVSTAGLDPVQSTVQVTAGPAAAFSLALASTQVTAGQALYITLTAVDAFGNRASTYRGTATFSSSDTRASVPAPYTFGATDSGSKIIDNALVLQTAGGQSVSVADAQQSIAGTTVGVQVSAAAAHSLILALTGGQVVAGAPVGLTVEALDAFGNLDGTYAGTVVFSSDDPQATLPAVRTFTSTDQGEVFLGAGVTFLLAGSRTLTVTDAADSIAGTVTVQVSAGPATQLILQGVPTQVITGQSLSPQLSFLDAYANVATQYSGVVQFSSSDPDATLPAATQITAQNQGSITLPNAVALYTPGTSSLSVVDTQQASLSATVSGIQVTYACHPYGNSLSGSGLMAAPPANYSAEFPSLALDSNGLPTIAWGDNRSGTFQIYVARWNGQAWVGYGNSATGLGISAQGNVNFYPAVALDGNDWPAVAWLATSGESYGPMLRRWNGDAWVDLTGSGATPGLGTTLGYSAGNTGLGLDANGNPYVAWLQDGNANLVYWNGGSWVGLGSNIVAASGVISMKMAMATNAQPAIVYVDYNYNLQSIQWLSGAWTNLGSPRSSGAQTQATVAIQNNGAPICAWTDSWWGPAQHIFLEYYASGWQGYGDSSWPGVESGNAFPSDPAIAMDAVNNPWLAWQDNSSGPMEIYLAHWDGSTWNGAGNSDSGGGISNGGTTAQKPNIAVDPKGHVIATWQFTSSTNQQGIYACSWY